MLKLKVLAALIVSVGLSACASVDTTRNISPTIAPPIQSSKSASWRVQDVRIDVPDSLTVSEANMYIPPTDIVWREDPFGDRRAQVKAIIDAAARRGVASLQGVQPVIVDIKVQRFHALSQKARATIGGQHTILFSLSVRDAATGMVLLEPTDVKASLKAFGGQQGIDASMKGNTQKVRITRHVAAVIEQQLKAFAP